MIRVKLAAILIVGVIDASWLFIVAGLVFGVPNVLNLAHGSQFADAVASVVGWYYGGDIGLDIF